MTVVCSRYILRLMLSNAVTVIKNKGDVEKTLEFEQ